MAKRKARRRTTTRRINSTAQPRVASTDPRVTSTDRPAVLPRRTVQLPFGPLILRGSCVVCHTTLGEHFKNGEYVGCKGIERQPHVPVTYVPPVVIGSEALVEALLETHATNELTDAMVQSNSGAVIRSEPTASRVGRRPELITPRVESIGNMGAKVSNVFEHITKHAPEGGITLKALVEEMRLPYSTVQSQVNKLLAAKAVNKRLAA